MPSEAKVRQLQRGAFLTKTANYTVTEKDHLKTFISGAADLVYTLPPANTRTAGLRVSFFTSTLSTTTGVSISPASVDKIQGKGITAADNKDLINTAATDAVGDIVTLECDGVDGWFIVNMLGTWAREA